MKLAECRVRELAHRDEGRPRNEVCPRNGPVTHQPKRPQTKANAPELENNRRRRALRLIGLAFAGLAGYLAVQSTVVLVAGHQGAHQHGTVLVGGLAGVRIEMRAS